MIVYQFNRKAIYIVKLFSYLCNSSFEVIVFNKTYAGLSPLENNDVKDWTTVWSDLHMFKEVLSQDLLGIPQ